MIQNLIKAVSTILLLCIITGANAQQAIVATGGNGTGVGGSVSYSTGQVSYSTIQNLDASISEGVQQPYEIFTVSLNSDSGIKLTVYPNPSSDYLTLDFDNTDLAGVVYQIYDANGKLLIEETAISVKTAISIKDFVPATYFLKASKGNTEVAVFKIVKN